MQRLSISAVCLCYAIGMVAILVCVVVGLLIGVRIQ